MSNQKAFAAWDRMIAPYICCMKNTYDSCGHNRENVSSQDVAHGLGVAQILPAQRSQTTGYAS